MQLQATQSTRGSRTRGIPGPEGIMSWHLNSSWQYALLLMSLIATQLVAPTSAVGVRRLLQTNDSTTDETTGAVSHRQLGLVTGLLGNLFGDHSKKVPLEGGYLSDHAFKVDIDVGSPFTTYTLTVETGSDRIWLGAGKSYVKTATSTDTGTQFSITYGSGSASGEVWEDQVALGSGEVTGRVKTLGVASTTQGFSDTDGVLGLGRADISLPFQLKQDGVIPSATFALCLGSGITGGGTLYLGGVPKQGLGQPYALTYAPMLDSEGGLYEVANPTDVYLNGASIPDAAAALAADNGARWIVDSATTLTLLGTNLYSAIFAALKAYSGCPNQYFSNEGGLDFIDLKTCDPPMDRSSLDAIYARFPTLAIKLQGTAVVAQPKSYAIFDPYAGVPLTTNNPSQEIIGLNPGISPEDGDVKIIGQSFMSDNLIVFDNDNNQVGFTAVACRTMQPLLHLGLGALNINFP